MSLLDLSDTPELIGVSTLSLFSHVLVGILPLLSYWSMVNWRLRVQIVQLLWYDLRIKKFW